MMTLSELETGAAIVYDAMVPTPQQRWPLLDARCGATVWVKHENHTPVGAFKVRGGLVYFDHLKRDGTAVKGVVAATRGNHGQSIGFAAARHGIPAAIVVPHGNSTGKNRAMRALGVELIEEGHDFQASLEAASRIAAERGWHMVPSFDRLLVRGVASYALELFRAVPDLDTFYVPIGLGSGICGAIAARARSVCARESSRGRTSAPAARSLAIGRPYRDATTRIADGMACRTPVAEALDIIRRGIDRVVEVSDDAIEEAMRAIYDDTHNVAEGRCLERCRAAAGADRQRNRHVAVVLTGGNVDGDVFGRILTAQPAVRPTALELT